MWVITLFKKTTDKVEFNLICIYYQINLIYNDFRNYRLMLFSKCCVEFIAYFKVSDKNSCLSLLSRSNVEQRQNKL